MTDSEWAGTEWAGAPALEVRSIDSFTDMPGLTEQLLEVQGLRAQPWRALSIRQALGIPAVNRAVSLIGGLVGSLVLETFREGRILQPIPRLVARPDPFDTPRGFYGGSAWNLATRGEAIWYHAAQGVYGEPLSLLNLPLAEVQVEWADESRWARSYRWRDRDLNPRRITHIRKSLEAGELRGEGPLQLCGATLTAAAEADAWAATYFAEGGISAVHLHSEAKLSDAEADRLRQRWAERTGALRVTSGGIVKSESISADPDGMQLLETRLHSRGEVAVMFGIPAKLLEYAESGSSLTYQNVGDVMTEFVRQELAPGYLEPIEQAMSDLLSRATVARFNVSGLQRADPKTRYEIHKTAIEVGIYTAEYAARDEGIELNADNADLAPVPALERMSLGGLLNG